MLVATVPGFGGLYLDDGVLTVYLTDPGQRAKAQAALAASPLAAYGEVRVLKGDYTYTQLDGWRRRLSPKVLGVPGVTLAGLHEAKNRVIVGVEHAATAGAVRRVVARLGLPPAAVVVEEVKPVQPLATLRDKVQSVVGGLQVWTPKMWTEKGAGCTLGFNAVHQGEESFLTNSHCTDVQGGIEGSKFYQGQGPAGSSNSQFLGTEVDDPLYIQGPALWETSWDPTIGRGVAWPRCGEGMRCRWSDAARIRYEPISDNVGEWGQGRAPWDFRIARPRGCSGTCNAVSGGPFLDIVGDWPVLGDNAPVAALTAGARFHKVGRSTGWTWGELVGCRFDFTQGNTNFVLLDQCWVNDAASWFGDSGSPVFVLDAEGELGGAPNYAYLAGIVWGGTITSDGKGYFVFSPMENVELELGQLQITW